MSGVCDTYWGSHGCDLRLGHLGPHHCGSDDSPCSEYDEAATLIRSMWWEDDDDFEIQLGWSEWEPAYPCYRC